MKKLGIVFIVLCSIFCFPNCADSKTFMAKVEETKTIYHNGVAKDTIIVSEKRLPLSHMAGLILAEELKVLNIKLKVGTSSGT